MKDVKNILVVCGMVRFCSKVVHYGVSLSQKFGAELYVMDVIHDPFGTKGWSLPLPNLEADYRKLREKTGKELRAIIEREKKEGTVIHELVREGKPVDEITRVVREEDIDLLLLPAHEETRIERFFFGHDNEELIRRMPCSILLVKRGPDDHNAV
jgi:universal stress protein A